jgi:hypothetical protein
MDADGVGEGWHLYELVYLQKDQNWKNEENIYPILI